MPQPGTSQAKQGLEPRFHNRFGVLETASDPARAAKGLVPDVRNRFGALEAASDPARAAKDLVPDVRNRFGVLTEQAGSRQASAIGKEKPRQWRQEVTLGHQPMVPFAFPVADLATDPVFKPM
jgi:hypothetical protein